MNGMALNHIDYLKSDLQGLGVNNFMDRVNILKHIENLVNNQQQAQQIKIIKIIMKVLMRLH